MVDAGCGFAELYVYLFKNDIIPKEYIGLDMEEQMINLAKKRLAEIELKVTNILEDTLIAKDYYICSGALNILTKEEILIFINKCFNNSNKGFIFNFLKKDTLNDVDYSEVIEFCKTLPCEIKVQNGYLDNDISVYLKKLLD
ncbi:class I SAM-dependent methyltransferase [Arcobacter sp. YIC-80]|uniref:class I SAM-dependent methyltransferase n=1 Tax=Arcobacter sp. YIC-80 TaxID=3376683 RepID=UPI00384D1AA3